MYMYMYTMENSAVERYTEFSSYTVFLIKHSYMYIHYCDSSNLERYKLRTGKPGRMMMRRGRPVTVGGILTRGTGPPSR